MPMYDIPYGSQAADYGNDNYSDIFKLVAGYVCNTIHRVNFFYLYGPYETKVYMMISRENLSSQEKNTILSRQSDFIEGTCQK